MSETRGQSSDASCGSEPLYTIGHSNHTEDEFLRLLQRHEIGVVADVRSQPYSRYSPQFNRESLQAALRQAGIEYLFLGKELGGRPEGDIFYDDQGHVLYGQVATSAEFLNGLNLLRAQMERGRLAMMCSEEDPAVCHRHLLVARVAIRRGLRVLHIRGDGRLQRSDEVADRDGLERQGLLFQELENELWRSLQSVLPKRPPLNSSES